AGRWIVRALRLRRRWRWRWRRRWWWWFAVHKLRALPGRAPRFKLSLQEKKAARRRLLTAGVSAMVFALGGNHRRLFFASRFMKTRFAIALTAGSLVATTLYGQDPKPLTVHETVDSLVAKNIKAKGGADALNSVKTLRLQGKMIVNQGRLQLPYDQF